MDATDRAKYDLVKNRSLQRMVQEDGFKRQPEKIKAAMLSHPPYMMYRLKGLDGAPPDMRARPGHFVQILSYHAHKDPHSKTPADVTVYAATEDNPDLRKDYVMHRIRLEWLERTDIHRAAAQVLRKSRGYKG